MFVTFGFVCCIFQITFDLSAIPGEVAVSIYSFQQISVEFTCLKHVITTGVNYAYSIAYCTLFCNTSYIFIFL